LQFSQDSKIPVGEMLRVKDGIIYFQFDKEFPMEKLKISPFKLQMRPEPQTPTTKETSIFDGLFGVFADSLPDGWGLMMMSRAMKRLGLDFRASSALDRLCMVGDKAIGALIYEPAFDDVDKIDGDIDLVKIAKETRNVLNGKADDILPELMILGGSPGGARPKVLVGVEKEPKDENPTIISGISALPKTFEPWIIKFTGQGEDQKAPIIEYIYSQTAHHVGISIPASKLFVDKKGQHWFGVKRFDRGEKNSRLHIHTAAGLMHANFRLPSLDYEDLLLITSALTKNHQDLCSMFRLACFNVIFHNRDDHGKNFSFCMSQNGVWRLAPAYDLTYSIGPGREHTTAVLGEGVKPNRSHLLKLAEKCGIKQREAQAVLQEVEEGKVFFLKLLKQHQIKSHPIQKHFE